MTLAMVLTDAICLGLAAFFTRLLNEALEDEKEDKE